MNRDETLEIRVPVTPVRVTMYCKVDGDPLEFTGRSHLTYPQMYVHKCPTCHDEVTFKKIYPTVEFD